MDGQTTFAVLVGIALACFSLVMVGYSFFRGNESKPESSLQDSGNSDEGVGLDAIYDSIDTLELDHQLGNVPDQQYREQMRAYRLQAASIIQRQIEAGNAAPEILLEHEVLAARNHVRSAWKPCPQCDAPLPEPGDGSTDSTCPHCGAPLGDPSPNDSNGATAVNGESQAPAR